MSGPLLGARPSTQDVRDITHAGEMGVSTRLVPLEPGLFSLSVLPDPANRGLGLPGVRVSLPPGPAGRRESVSISTMRGDGWMTSTDEPTLLRVPSGGAQVLLTLYWAAPDAAAVPPALKLMRLDPEGIATGSTPRTPAQVSSMPPLAAEIVAHIEGVGDVDGKLGEWVGKPGGNRAIEGFSLSPRSGISSEDFEIRAVLGRDWLSPWLPGGSFCGSRGLALPLRGFCVRLRPAAAARVEFACSARFADGSEIGPVGPDLLCVTPALAALEAFRIQIRQRA